MAACRRIAWAFVVAVTLASCAAQAGAEAGRWSIEGEVIALRGKGTTDSIEPRFVAQTRGLATPLSRDYQLTQNDSYEFSVFGGVGPMFGTGWTAEQVPNRFESRTRTAF